MASPAMFDLSGRVAVVTGGNGGIGRGIALGLAEAGAAVAILARNEEKNRATLADLRARGVHALALKLDVTDRASLQPALSETERSLGPIDILVNNAGIAIAGGALKLEPEAWDRVLETNLNSCFLLAKYGAQSMAPRGAGKIINIASEYSRFGNPIAPSYAASKGGLIQLTKSMAIELAPHNIQVNAIVPGWIESDMTAPIKSRPFYDEILMRTPAGRFGTPAECAGAAVFLASHASDFVTGATVFVDGGYSIRRAGSGSPGGHAARLTGAARCRIMRGDGSIPMAKPRTRARAHIAAAGAPGAELGLPELRPLRVLVAGEVILDRYIWGDVERISPEAPIPVLRAHRREERPGNAGFVMANLRALGARPSALSVVGADRNGRMLREMFRDLGIDSRPLMVDPGRPTIVKERMLGSVQSANRATQQLLRVDEEDPRPLSPDRERELKRRLGQALKRADGVLVSDINKGLLTPGLLRALIGGANRRRIPIIIDPRLTDDLSIYHGATALTPNRYETELATGMKLADRDAWRTAAELLVRKLGLQACLITLDRDGMYLAERSGHTSYIPTTPREVYDVTGAGDVVLTFFGLLSIAGLSFSSAAAIANLAAGIEVGRIGTEIITREDIGRALIPAHNHYERKILSDTELKSALDRERDAERRVVFTNGCFDVLHAGHLQMLSFARAQGDLLVVGLNSDRSIRAIKGPDRPIYNAADRARMLAALEMVDYVVVFDEARAERIIRKVRPDVLVKGEDWRGKTVDGQAYLESHGGRVVLAPMLAGHSTTALISRIRRESSSAPRASGSSRRANS